MVCERFLGMVKLPSAFLAAPFDSCGVVSGLLRLASDSFWVGWLGLEEEVGGILSSFCSPPFEDSSPCPEGTRRGRSCKS